MEDESDWVDVRDTQQMGFSGIRFSQEARSTTMGTSTLALSTRKSNKAENYRAHIFCSHQVFLCTGAVNHLIIWLKKKGTRLRQNNCTWRLGLFLVGERKQPGSGISAPLEQALHCS